MKFNYFHKAVAVVMVMAAFGLTKASAQQSESDGTTLNVVLEPLLSIRVNDASVTLTLATASDYENGVSKSMPGHLTVSSLMSYTINLKSDNATLAGTTTPANTLNSTVVGVSLPTTSTNTGLGGTLTSIASLTASDQPLIADALPAVNRLIDVDYAIPSSKSNSTEVLGKPADTYHSTITYTISSL